MVGPTAHGPWHSSQATRMVCAPHVNRMEGAGCRVDRGGWSEERGACRVRGGGWRVMGEGWMEPV